MSKEIKPTIFSILKLICHNMYLRYDTFRLKRINKRLRNE
jgi:hypothetical protein